MTGPALYEGQVMHTRPSGARYLFCHRIYMWLVDLDRPVRMPLALRPFAGIRPRDHIGDPSRSIRENLDAYLADNGVSPDGGRVLMLTNARVLGYVFNPLTVYWCFDRGGDLRCLVAEVHNTHGERHLYTLRPRDAGSDTFVAAMDKAFYVSPFIEVRGGYEVRVRDEPTRLRITINQHQPEGLELHASLDLARRPLTDRNLARLLLRHPFLPQRTTALIHWHALRLWLRGARFHRHREATR